MSVLSHFCANVPLPARGNLNWTQELPLDLVAVEQEIDRLRRGAFRDDSDQDWDGKKWVLYLTRFPGPWSTIGATVGHIHSVYLRYIEGEINTNASRGLPHHTERIGNVETLADIFAYLPLLPLETGALFRRMIRFCGPRNFGALCYADVFGLESYEVLQQTRDGKHRITLVRVLPRSTPEAPLIREFVDSAILP